MQLALKTFSIGINFKRSSQKKCCLYNVYIDCHYYLKYHNFGPRRCIMILEGPDKESNICLHEIDFRNITIIEESTLWRDDLTRDNLSIILHYFNQQTASRLLYFSE